MGLTQQSSGLSVLRELWTVPPKRQDDIVVALAGNPNTGKSTVFNQLTGLKQHTGNWPGKTVTNAQGRYEHNGRSFTVVDLPGTYSLLANSVEEEVARDFICSGRPQATVVVADATSLERNLNLVLQILEITSQVVLCVNLLDEAQRKQISLDLKQLSALLGVPVVGTIARDGQGLQELRDTIYQVGTGEITPAPLLTQYEPVIENAIHMLTPLLNEVLAEYPPRWAALRLLEGNIDFTTGTSQAGQIRLAAMQEQAADYLRQQQMSEHELCDSIAHSLVQTGEQIAKQVVHFGNQTHNSTDRKIDRIVTSRHWGLPIMLALLGIVFWITLEGANYPSELLFQGLFHIEGYLSQLFLSQGWPASIHGILVLGIYRTLAWVVAVMLPPMAIFFPLFTFLEDLGYLPRIAFNLDSFFKSACAHGKQALAMCMGFGCNAAGVVACRIIDSPRERLIATMTNNYVPCNGRFPLLIALTSIFFITGSGWLGSVAKSLLMVALIVLSVLITLAASRFLSRTVLQGLPSSFTLELPPYRKPQLGRILLRSLLDRTLFVLARAIVVAAPAGAVIWVMANLHWGGSSLLDHAASWLQPIAYLMGLDGHILLAFILGFPANEIVIPLIIMSYTRSGALLELNSLPELRHLLIANGWTWLTALCTMLFSLNHWPCGTTLLTIRKETQSAKWTLSLSCADSHRILALFCYAHLSRWFGLV